MKIRKANNQLYALRKEKKLSLQELSNETGISVTVLSYLEIGKRPLTSKHLKLLAEFYHVSYDYLLNKTKSTLLELHLPTDKIELVLSNENYLASLQKEAIQLTIELLEEDDLEQVIILMKYLLSKENKKGES